MPTLILLNGPPASGKSTLAGRYVEHRPGALNLDIDVVRGMIGRWFDDPVGSGLAARSLAVTMAEGHLRAGNDVVVPQFLGKVDFIVELERVAEDTGSRFVEVMLMLERDDARSAFEHRTAAAASQTHRDAALLVERSPRRDPLGEMFDESLRMVEQRPQMKRVDVVNDDIELTFARFLGVVA